MRHQVLIAAGFSLFRITHAHLYLALPSPAIPYSDPKNPLDPSGSDFPCRNIDFTTLGAGTTMAVGSEQTLKIDDGSGANTAAHGGGSSQISITYETDPQKIKDPSNWKVIYSIVGGFPTNSRNNLNSQYVGPQGSYSGALQCTDPQANGVDCYNSFKFTIPKGLKNGKATLAWTWFNTLGNREMYMNCIPATITGGSSDTSGMSGFPRMYVANQASIDGGCTHAELFNVGFPNPGEYVTTKLASPNMGQTAIDYPISTNAACGGNGGVYHPNTAVGSAPSNVPIVQNQANIAGSSAVPAAVIPAQKAQQNSGEWNSPTSGYSTCPSGQTLCSPHGSEVCFSNGAQSDRGPQLGMCNFGCAVAGPAPAGTVCQNGQIVAAAHNKRHLSRHFNKRDSS